MILTQHYASRHPPTNLATPICLARCSGWLSEDLPEIIVASFNVQMETVDIPLNQCWETYNQRRSQAWQLSRRRCCTIFKPSNTGRRHPKSMLTHVIAYIGDLRLMSSHIYIYLHELLAYSFSATTCHLTLVARACWLLETLAPGPSHSPNEPGSATRIFWPSFPSLDFKLPIRSY